MRHYSQENYALNEIRNILAKFSHNTYRRIFNTNELEATHIRDAPSKESI